jgi:recombination protein RecA
MAKTKIQLEGKTGVPELDAVIQASSNKRGVDLSGIRLGSIKPFSTGSMRLDLALKIGGMPEGRVIEIFGQESTMKTSLALAALYQKQKTRLENGIYNKRDLILDIEHSMTDPFIEGFGIDLDQCIILQPGSAEEALQVSIDYAKSGAIDCILFDSVDAMQNEKQQRRSVGDADVGGISKDMAFAMRQISKFAVRYETTYIFINQIKMNPGEKRLAA